MHKQMVISEGHSFIDGEISSDKSGDAHPNYYPATNEVINEVYYASKDEARRAISSSLVALKVWSSMTVNQRSAVLLKAAEILRLEVADLAKLEVLDTGKPIAEALSVDVYSAADALEYFAKTALALEGSVVPNSDALIYTTQEPLGVCVGIGAWNYPLQIACWKAAPALMMGNTMIFKPSELTPMTALKLAEIFIRAGMPAGVFNVVLGDGAVAEMLLASDKIAKVSFTGSVPTGKKILRQVADSLIPVTLELGGKSPLIIFDDAEIDQAVSAALVANFYTQGEICSNGTRVFVSRDIHDKFVEKLVASTRKIVTGDPLDPNTQMGALISPAHMKKVMRYIDAGQSEGAELAFGGKALTTGKLTTGNFIEPTIFTACTDEMSITCEEIFGPVMSVLAFDDESEVISRANNTVYGLSAGLFTNDIKRGHRVAHQLQAGTCWINNYNVTPVGMPFGGYKHSGLGRENGKATLLSYTQQKSIYVELNKIENPYE